MRIHLFHDENEYGRAGRDDDDGDDEAHEEEVGRVAAVGRVVPRRAATVVKYKKGNCYSFVLSFMKMLLYWEIYRGSTACDLNWRLFVRMTEKGNSFGGGPN